MSNALFLFVMAAVGMDPENTGTIYNCCISFSGTDGLRCYTHHTSPFWTEIE